MREGRTACSSLPSFHHRQPRGVDAKLTSESVVVIDAGPLEAMQAVGANSLQDWGRVGMILYGMIAVVTVIDYGSGRLRKQLA